MKKRASGKPQEVLHVYGITQCEEEYLHGETHHSAVGKP